MKIFTVQVSLLHKFKYHYSTQSNWIVVAIINGQDLKTLIYIGTLLMNTSIGFSLKYLWNKIKLHDPYSGMPIITYLALNVEPLKLMRLQHATKVHC